MEKWFSLKSDEGAVLWGILCCWCGVLVASALIWAGISIQYIVPLILFGTPAMVTLCIWLLSLTLIDRRV